MKKRTVGALLALLVLCIFCYLIVRFALNKSPEKSLITEVEKERESPPVERKSSISNLVSDPVASAKEIIREHKIEREVRKDWETPIEFYGKVLDAHNMPVAEAGVEFAWTDLSKSGRSQKKAQSDSNGLFSLTGVRGKHLSVKVTKQNYYSAKSNLDSFFYAGENVNFVPDRTNLIVFRLKKRGSGERLLRTSGRIKVPLTAEPIELDLITAKPVRLGEGDIRLECSSDYLHKNEDRQFDWGLKVFVPGGDLVESKDELDFEAPEKGYAPTYELKMPSSLENSWANSVEKTFFFKLKNGNFARVSFLFISYNGVFRFESFVNPSGSRNLEYDPAVQAVQAVFE